MHQWPQHIRDEMDADDSDDWDAVAAVTLWTGNVEHRVDTAECQDLGTHLDIKVHSDQFAASGLPMGLSGCECLVSMDSTQVRDPDPDDEPDESYYGTISNQRAVGQHIIVSLPTTGPVAYTP
jgi:hypothetical protein